MHRVTFIIAAAIISVNTALALPGSGTEADPWRIESLPDFDEFVGNANYWDDYIRLECDIDLSGRTYENAVIAPDANNANLSFEGTPFTGVFDGNDNDITALRIDDAGAGNDYLGLFGCLDGGEVRNLGLEGGSVSGDWCVGSIAGGNGDWTIPGGRIRNCHSNSDVTGQWCAGGLVGGNYGSVSDCYSTSETSGDQGVGGLVGYNKRGSVSNCYSTGETGGDSGYGVGGLVGISDQGSISDCYSTGATSGRTGIGGLVGANDDGSVSNCYSTGDVNINDWCAGGLIGQNWGSSAVSNSYSLGDVSGEEAVGGLVGGNWGSVSNGYSTGDVNGVEEIGGLVGVNYSGSVSNGFWDTGTQTHGVIYSIGAHQEGTIINVAGLPTTQMQTSTSFVTAGWDFAEIWGIGEQQTYPFLRKHPAGELNLDGRVDFRDLAILVRHWLEGAEQ